RIVGADRLQHLAAIDLGQVEVQQHDRGQLRGVAVGVPAPGEQVVERGGAIAAPHQLVGDLRLLEREPGQLDVVGVVFDQQDFLAHRHWVRMGAATSGGAAGSSSSKLLPPSGGELALSRPWWRSAMRCAVARPNPWPPPWSGPCRRWNGSNNLWASR